MTWKNNCCFKNFEELRIKQFKYWSWVLNPSQDPFLGRSIAYLNRHAVELTEINEKETRELFLILKLIEKTFDNLFIPDKYNFAALGNKLEHLHMHVVPRYKKPKKVFGRTFKDTYWGESFDKQDSTKHTPVKLNTAIANKIKRKVI